MPLHKKFALKIKIKDFPYAKLPQTEKMSPKYKIRSKKKDLKFSAQKFAPK